MLKCIACVTALLCLTFLGGCKNSCEHLAEKVCDRAGEDHAEADCGDATTDKAKQEACARIQAVAASCRTLIEKAPDADDDDLAGCKANLELVKTLEQAQR